jgi:hypothetical protein
MLSVVWALAYALVFALPLHAATIRITLDSFSRNAVYKPAVNGSLENTGAWNATFTDTPWYPYARGTEGAGTGYHFATYNASRDAPYVLYDFYGTGIEFFGFWGHLGQGLTSGGGYGTVQLFVQGGGYTGPQNIPFTGRNTQRTMKSAQPVSLGSVSLGSAGFYTVGMYVTESTVSFTHAVLDVDFP